MIRGLPVPPKRPQTLYSSQIGPEVGKSFWARMARTCSSAHDFPTLKTVDHVATTPGLGKSAWFKDPDDNMLALFQPE